MLPVLIVTLTERDLLPITATRAAKLNLHELKTANLECKRLETGRAT